MSGVIANTIKALKVGFESARQMTLKEFLGMMFGVCLVTFGNSGQLLAVNEWLTLFPDSASGPFTVLTITATSTTIFFVTCFLIWCCVKKPNVDYLWTKECWLLSIVCGAGNAGNGVLIVSATPGTPEILQAFLFSSTIFWTFILMKLVNRDSRNYFSPLVVLSFVFSLGGIVVGSASQFSSSSPPPSDCGTNFTKVDIIDGVKETITGTYPPCTPAPATPPKWWIAVFSGGMLMVAIYNVLVYRFMTKYSTTKGRPLSILSGSGSFGASFGSSSFATRKKMSKRDFDEAITLKLAMLFATGITQTVWMWCFTMMDALPNFGSSPNLGEVYKRIGIGYKCVFDANYPPCQGTQNGLYAFLFAFAYVLNYFGTAYLNSYSAAVTSMVTQLSSPVVALILLIIPSWNVSQQPISIPESVTAIICLIIGAILYTAWEESTRQQIEEEETDKFAKLIDGDGEEPDETSKLNV